MGVGVASQFGSLVPLLQFDVEEDVLDPVVVIDVHQDPRPVAVLRDEDRLVL
jgi:hypothetical protein